MFFGSGEVLERVFICGEILERWSKFGIEFENGEEFAIGSGELAFLAEGNAEEISRLDILRIGFKERIEESDAFIEFTLMDERFSLSKIIFRSLSGSIEGQNGTKKAQKRKETAKEHEGATGTWCVDFGKGYRYCLGVAKGQKRGYTQVVFCKECASC